MVVVVGGKCPISIVNDRVGGVGGNYSMFELVNDMLGKTTRIDLCLCGFEPTFTFACQMCVEGAGSVATIVVWHLLRSRSKPQVRKVVGFL